MADKLKQYIVLMAMITIIPSCQNDDSNLDKLISQSKEEPVEVSFLNVPLIESADSAPDPTDETYNDYIESFSPKEVVKITYDGNVVTMENSSDVVEVTHDGAHVIVNTAEKTVKLVLTGNSTNGSLKILGQNRCLVVMENLTLTNPDGAVINNQCKKTLYIENSEGTVNTLKSGMATTGDADAKGCIFSEGQICFSGSGHLSVLSTFRNAIASDDYIFVRPQAWLTIDSSTGNGIKANDGVRINGGTIDIHVSYNGGKGINSEAEIDINGGRTTIINEGTTRLDEVAVSAEFPQGIDTVNCAGVKCDNAMNVSAGQLIIKCSGDDAKGIKTGNYSQTGGNVTIVAIGQKVLSSPKGIKSDQDLIVSAGSLYSYSKYSTPIDADGQLRIYAYRKQKSYLVEIGK